MSSNNSYNSEEYYALRENEAMVQEIRHNHVFIFSQVGQLYMLYHPKEA